MEKFTKLKFLPQFQFDIQPEKPITVNDNPAKSNKVKENEKTSVLEKLVNVKGEDQDESMSEENHGDMV